MKKKSFVGWTYKEWDKCVGVRQGAIKHPDIWKQKKEAKNRLSEYFSITKVRITIEEIKRGKDSHND